VLAWRLNEAVETQVQTSEAALLPAVDSMLVLIATFAANGGNSASQRDTSRSSRKMMLARPGLVQHGRVFSVVSCRCTRPPATKRHQRDFRGI
jgi:hypothetical protein